MATAFTHVLVGAAFARWGPRTRTRGPRLRLVAVLALLAVAPDLDVIGLRLGIPYSDPLGHRGLTHSLLFALGCGLITPRLAGAHRSSLLEWWRLVILGALATASHGALDALTNGGLGVGFLIPFSDERWFAPWRPLLVSPLSAAAFFNETGLRILTSEVLWIWLPLFVSFAVVAFVRRK
jgi:inner membrane protein